MKNHLKSRIESKNDSSIFQKMCASARGGIFFFWVKANDAPTRYFFIRVRIEKKVSEVRKK